MQDEIMEVEVRKKLVYSSVPKAYKIYQPIWALWKSTMEITWN